LAQRTRLPRWARERGAALNDFPALAPGRTALVNVDMQAAFIAEDQPYGSANARGIVANVNALSQAMRAAGAPVIWTRQTYTHEPPLAPPEWQYDPARPGVAAGMAALTAGSSGHGLYGEMDVAERDLVLDK
jgi:ureidoacrylate peracid hydrolase